MRVRRLGGMEASVSDDSDKPRPALRVVAENNTTTVNHERHRWLYEQPLRALSANIIRVSRGAGKPDDILADCINVATKFQEYLGLVGVWPPGFEIQELLSAQKSYYPSRAPDYYDEIEDATETIISGALRVAAARLVRQDLQERLGERELKDGVRAIERCREEIRAKRAAELRAARPSIAKPRKAPKKRPQKK
jgi:hypothetical protein